MNVFKKTILAVAATLSLLGPIAVTTANPPAGHAMSNAPAEHQHPHRRIYYVYYRSSPHLAWVNYGGYYHHSQAEQAVEYFRYYGYDAFIR